MTDTGAMPTRFREARASLSYVNEAGVPESVADAALRSQEVAQALSGWMQRAKGETRTVDVFNRHGYNRADHIFAQMGQCAAAVEDDDVLSTAADVTEALMFQKVHFELNNEDEQDIWNQYGAELDLDSRLREMGRELYKVSQFYAGLWWDERVYTVRTPPARRGGGGRGNRTRRKQFALRLPTAITLLDPTKVLPVGSMLFGRERFAYIADPDEHRAFGSALGGDIVDEVVLKLVERRYNPPPAEQRLLADLDLPADRLWLMRADAVFRHTLTRASYERFALPRLRAALPVLELKQHLRASDRSTLIGNTNFIVVIRKGSDKIPAQPAEIENLQEQVRVVARLPILVGDHRLSVDIVTPPTDNTLIESRYSVLDARLVFKALGTFQPQVQGGNTGGRSVSEMSRVVARGLEARRHQLGRTLEARLFAPIVAANPEQLTERPGLTFSPRRVALEFNTDIVNAVLKVRDRGDLSRETMLEELDYDQDTEYLRRVREADDYDDGFQSIVPHNSPQANPFGKPTDPDTTPEGGRPSGVVEDEPRQPAQGA